MTTHIKPAQNVTSAAPTPQDHRAIINNSISKDRYPVTTKSDFDIDTVASLALKSDGTSTNPNQLIRIDGIIGRRDFLTEIQQKIIIVAIMLIHDFKKNDSSTIVCRLPVDEFIRICSLDQKEDFQQLTDIIENLQKKGIWLYDIAEKKLTRSLWFQSIEYTADEIAFQFSENIIPLIAKFALFDAEHQLVKGLQYKGKHTLAVFSIIWELKEKGLIEYSIPQLMRQLALEHTRYSYGQLKLRVLEPAFEEIYSWDDAIFVRFGPTYSGRRVEGVWLEITVGEEARELRRSEPEFKVALPEQKPSNLMKTEITHK